MAYKLLDFADIYTAVLEELKIPSSDTVEVARVKRDINSIYINEVVPFSRWKWLEGFTTVKVPQVYQDGSADATFGSTTITLSTAPSSTLGSFKNKIFSVDSSAETYIITAHTAGSATLTIDHAFNGTTNDTSPFKIWSDWVSLPTDLRETVEIWHDFDRQPLSARGLQEFRKLQNATRKTQGRPIFTYTGDFVDPTPDTDETESDRVRALWVHPAIFTSATNLHVSYIKEVPALEDDGDEPVMPIEDRIVLLYGALARAWRRQRNPEASVENFNLFQNKLARMAGKVEDSFDKPSFNPDSLYISAKRGPRGSARSLAALGGTGTGGGSSTAVTYLQDVTINGANVTGNMTVANGITVDGRDISADGTALDTVVSDLAAHLADTTDAHDASAISFTPTGTISSINVQDAIAELESEVGTINSLADGKILLGDNTNTAQEVTISGDIALSNTGVASISAGVVVDADINASAAIARTKIASGTANHVVINDPSGVLSSEATLAKSRGGTGADNSSVTFPSSGVIVTEAATQTLTGKTIDGDDNTVQDLALSSLKTVLADASKFLVRDGSGNVVSNTKAVPSGDVVGTSDAQNLSSKTFTDDTQFNAKIKLKETGGGADTIDITAPASAAAYTITLPGAAPTANTALAYDGSNYVWSSAGGWTTYANENISASGSVTNSTTVGQQYRRVTGNGAAITLSTTPFGTAGTWSDGLVIRLVGGSSTNTVTIVHNDAANGAILDGDCTLGQYDVIELQWDSTASRWIEIARSVK